MGKILCFTVLIFTIFSNNVHCQNESLNISDSSDLDDWYKNILDGKNPSDFSEQSASAQSSEKSAENGSWDFTEESSDEGASGSGGASGNGEDNSSGGATGNGGTSGNAEVNSSGGTSGSGGVSQGLSEGSRGQTDPVISSPNSSGQSYNGFSRQSDGQNDDIIDIFSLFWDISDGSSTSYGSNDGASSGNSNGGADGASGGNSNGGSGGSNDGASGGNSIGGSGAGNDGASGGNSNGGNGASVGNSNGGSGASVGNSNGGSGASGGNSNGGSGGTNDGASVRNSNGASGGSDGGSGSSDGLKSEVKTIQLNLAKNSGFISSLIEHLINLVGIVQTVSSNVEYYGKNTQSLINKSLQTAGNTFSTPEVLIIYMVGNIISRVLSIVSSITYFIPIIGGRLSSGNEKVSVCVSNVTYQLDNTIVAGLTSCAKSPVNKIGNLIPSLTSNIKKLSFYVQLIIGKLYLCDGIACRLQHVVSTGTSIAPIMISLIYNIATGVGGIGISLVILLPCLISTIPITVVRNIISKGLEMVHCLFG